MEGKGQQLFEEAEKSAGKWALPWNREEKYENCREKYLKASTFFKASQSWQKAGRSYEGASKMAKKMGSEIDYLSDIHNAALAYRKAEDPRSATLLKEVIDAEICNGKPQYQVAKLMAELADDPAITEAERQELLKNAAQNYEEQNSVANATEINQKSAETKILTGDFQTAATIYTQLANTVLNDRMMRGMARKYFFMSLLAQLAAISPSNVIEGVAQAENAFREYQSVDNQFNEYTREHILITSILGAIEATSLKMFLEGVEEYKTICPTDKFKQKLLNKINELIVSEENKGR